MKRWEKELSKDRTVYVPEKEKTEEGECIKIKKMRKKIWKICGTKYQDANEMIFNTLHTVPVVEVEYPSHELQKKMVPSLIEWAKRRGFVIVARRAKKTKRFLFSMQKEE